MAASHDVRQRSALACMWLRDARNKAGPTVDAGHGFEIKWG
jgi:hypothetical protein